MERAARRRVNLRARENCSFMIALIKMQAPNHEPRMSVARKSASMNFTRSNRELRRSHRANVVAEKSTFTKSFQHKLDSVKSVFRRFTTLEKAQRLQL